LSIIYQHPLWCEVNIKVPTSYTLKNNDFIQSSFNTSSLHGIAGEGGYTLLQLPAHLGLNRPPLPASANRRIAGPPFYAVVFVD
jgi:hypothetical protein